MRFTRKYDARLANPADRSEVVRLGYAWSRVHAHLDWQPIDEWLSAQPFLLATRGRHTAGALACPPDPSDTAWIRLFACADGEKLDDVWDLLWPLARQALETANVCHVAGLSLEGWMDPLYLAAGFVRTHAVVVLTRPIQPGAAEAGAAASNFAGVIRPARASDFEAITAVDIAAFASPWQVSPAVVRVAIAQADYLTVAEAGGRVVGYQLTTAGQQSGAHLARLGVWPEWQGQGIGTALVADLIQHYSRLPVRSLSVNTQDSNAASLRVYGRFGFNPNGLQYPAYQLRLR